MSLERRLVDALHQADDYDPSPDLFSRLGRSISEDLAHRRRVRMAYLGVLAGLAAIAGYLAVVVDFGRSGPTLASWELALLELAILGSLLIVLGPLMGRFGQGYVADVFHLSAETARRFSKLLDIAYYLLFTGLILVEVADFGPLDVKLPFPAALEDSAFRIGLFLTFMGLLHSVNIVALPVIGLFFNSTIRRARRQRAGASTPPVSPRAAKAEKLVGAVVLILTLLAVGAGLFLVFSFILQIVGSALGG